MAGQKRLNIDKVRIPLFWKFTIGMVIVVILFGGINVTLVHRIIFSSLEKELEQRGIFMSHIISQRAINYLLFDDLVALNVLLDEVQGADDAIEYILVCDTDCKILAHTFDKPVPEGLYYVHDRSEIKNEVLRAHVRFDGSDQIFRDISIPLMEGGIGFLRVGISETHIEQTLNKATRTLLGMILILIGISLIGTFIFSYLVTSPVKDISHIAENLDMQSIREKKLMLVSRYPVRGSKFMRILPGDEIDILVSKFNEMVFRLQQAYDDLETAQRKVVQSEKLASIGTLAAGLAHEVNNPLAGIMNCIARMKKNPENKAEAAKYLDLMEEATSKVEVVIRNLLNFARQPDVEKSKVSLAPVVENAIALATHKLEKCHIHIAFENNAGQLLFHANKNQLEQVFLNLILNGIDAVEEKKEQFPDIQGEILITATPVKNNRSVKIEVSDNGIGIPNEYMNKVVDPFFTTKSVGKGTGLGLSVSMNIIREHRGEMEIESEYLSGTVLRIVLPVAVV